MSQSSASSAGDMRIVSADGRLIDGNAETIGYFGTQPRAAAPRGAVDSVAVPPLSRGAFVRGSDRRVFVLSGSRRHFIGDESVLRQFATRRDGELEPPAVTLLDDDLLRLIPEGSAARAAQLIESETDLGAGHFMRSTLHLAPDASTVHVDTTAWTVGPFGFTGAATLLALDPHQRVLAASDFHAMGVDGWTAFWAAHSRTDTWYWDLPAGTVNVRILHVWAPRDRWSSFIENIAVTIARVVELGKKLEEFCREFPGICRGQFARSKVRTVFVTSSAPGEAADDREQPPMRGAETSNIASAQ